MQDLTYKDRVQMMMNAGISFCTILMAEGTDGEEAAARAAEIAAELLCSVEYEIAKMDEEEEAEDVPGEKDS